MLEKVWACSTRFPYRYVPSNRQVILREKLKHAVQIIGLLLNMSHFTCTTCTTPHELFGSSAKFEKAAKDLKLEVLGELNPKPDVSHDLINTYRQTPTGDIGE